MIDCKRITFINVQERQEVKGTIGANANQKMNRANKKKLIYE
jgi:hypothetical protein